VLAPTGTIAFMMDCDTTGVEPDIALVKYKKLVGGGFLKIVNGTVPMALRKLGYSEPQIMRIVDWIDEHETIEDAPGPGARASAGVRLRVPRAARHAQHPLDGARAHDGRGAAVPVRRDQQDR
jgi:ribonucleotide reductase alpha subunit